MGGIIIRRRISFTNSLSNTEQQQIMKIIRKRQNGIEVMFGYVAGLVEIIALC